jgi:hypothetical protein
MVSHGALAWGSLRSNHVLGLENTYAPSHDYILEQSYYNLESDPAFAGSNFPSIEAILNNEGLYADAMGSLTGESPDVTAASSKHEYNPTTKRGGAPSEASKFYGSLKADLLVLDSARAAKDSAWLAHYIADLTCPFNINGMPPEDVPQENPLVLLDEDIGYPLPIANSGMGRIINSLSQGENPNAKLISGIPADAPVRGRGWYDNKASNWSYEYVHFRDLQSQDKDGKYDWFDPWHNDGTYKYILNYVIGSYTQELFKESSTHLLWEWYAYRNYSRPNYPITQVNYSLIFIKIQQSKGNGVDGNIEEFAEKIAADTKSHQRDIFDESVSGIDNLVIHSKLGESYQEAIRDVYNVWRASFSALRPSVVIKPSYEVDNGKRSYDVEIKIKNAANESAKNVRITAGSSSSVWNISPTTYNVPDEIPAGNEISNLFMLTGATTNNSNEFNISFIVTGNYQDTPDSGLTKITFNVKPNQSVIVSENELFSAK